MLRECRENLILQQLESTKSFGELYIVEFSHIFAVLFYKGFMVVELSCAVTAAERRL